MRARDPFRSRGGGIPVVHQVVATLARFDAVSEEALVMHDALRELGYETELFAESVAGAFRPDVRPLPELRGSPDGIIVHYSIWSQAVERAARLKVPLIVRYHNVTPPQWFEGVNDAVADLCRRARDGLPKLASRCVLALADSEFNRCDLMAAGYNRTAVLPILMREKTAPGPLEPDSRPLILTVGRIAPNKRIEEVLRVFALFQRACRPDAALAVVGSPAGFERYDLACRRLADRLGLRNTTFTGPVTEEEKDSFYRRAAGYISLSEHEGFGVPLVEAMHFRIPVLARAAGAVAETLGTGGLAVETKDHAELAELLDILVSDPDVRATIRAGQRRELERFAPSVVRERFAKMLAEVVP